MDDILGVIPDETTKQFSVLRQEPSENKVRFVGHRHIDNILKAEEQLETIIRMLLSEHEVELIIITRSLRSLPIESQ